MPAQLLHNTLFLKDIQRTPPVVKPSAVSTVSLQTTPTRQSYPTEPLLPSSPKSPGFSSPRRPEVAGLGHSGGTHESGTAYDGDSSSQIDRKGYWQKAVRKRLKMVRWWKRLLLTITNAWALYNTFRYFLSFPQFLSQERQLFALFLGASTTISMALVAVLLLFNLIFADSPPELGAMHTIQHIILPYLASCFLLLPTIVNLVLVFVWKHSSNTENTIRGRCHWDIDVVWSGVGDHCSSYTSWPAWLLGAVFRLLFTAGFLAAYHALNHHQKTLHAPLPNESPYTRFPSQRRHHHRDSSLGAIPDVGRDQMAYAAVSTISAPPTVHRHQYHRSAADASVDIETPSAPSSSTTHTVTAHEPAIETSTRSISTYEVKRTPNSSPAIIPSELPSGTSTTTEDSLSLPESDRSYRPPPGISGELGFSALVDQISKETDDGIHTARPDSRAAHYRDSYGSYSDDGEEVEGEYNPYSEAQRDPQQDWYYDEFGQPILYDDEDRIEVFGRLVHRMPTIESLGSREHNSLAPTMSLHQIERELSNTRSDAGSPLSWTPSGSWSRRNPFATELGELLPSPTRPPLDSSGRARAPTTASSRSTTNNTFYSAEDGTGRT